MRTTTVRKLLPESWGFLCPVHTPDGAPCGLLSHLNAPARVVAAEAQEPADVILAICQVGAGTQQAMHRLLPLGAARVWCQWACSIMRACTYRPAHPASRLAPTTIAVQCARAMPAVGPRRRCLSRRG